MVTIQVSGDILEFTALSLVQVLNSRDSRRLRVFEICLEVFDECSPDSHNGNARETERSPQPGNGLFDDPIDYVRKQASVGTERFEISAVSHPSWD